MKRTVFFMVFLLGFGSLALSESMSGSNVLMFETADGKILTMEVVQEQAVIDDIPVMLRPIVCDGTIDPEDHGYFQALMLEIRKPEKEDPLPFERN